MGRYIMELTLYQCSKLLPVCQPEADNFGGGPETFLKLFFNFMFMILDSRTSNVFGWVLNTDCTMYWNYGLLMYTGSMMYFDRRVSAYVLFG